MAMHPRLSQLQRCIKKTSLKVVGSCEGYLQQQSKSYRPTALTYVGQSWRMAFMLAGVLSCICAKNLCYVSMSRLESHLLLLLSHGLPSLGSLVHFALICKVIDKAHNSGISNTVLNYAFVMTCRH